MLDLHDYLLKELGITEIDPASFVLMLSKEFLEKQSDAWIARLYEFLRGQPALLQSDWVLGKPIIRLEEGSHVPPRVDGRPQAYLPGPTDTEFPTAKRSICRRPNARKFLVEIGLADPDPVDDVLHNILHRYAERADSYPRQYDADIRRIVEAFQTDSSSRRDSLVERLRNAYWIPSRNAETGELVLYTVADNTYLPTDKLRSLFRRNPSVWFVDCSRPCFRDKRCQELLAACGVPQHLKRRKTSCTLPQAELSGFAAMQGLHAPLPRTPWTTRS